jgi:hypothetical protein
MIEDEFEGRNQGSSEMRVMMCVSRSFSSEENESETDRKRQTESRKESRRTTVESEHHTHEGLAIGVC